MPAKFQKLSTDELVKRLNNSQMELNYLLDTDNTHVTREEIKAVKKLVAYLSIELMCRTAMPLEHSKALDSFILNKSREAVK